MIKKTLTDRFGRKHDYLRISVTDRCNLRCIYCMGPEGVPFLDHAQILRYEEIVSVVKAAAELGISKVRLTGGEPLVRKGIEHLIGAVAAIPGITDLAMTTNGQLLAPKAAQLKEAGLKRVNISLDTLKPGLYNEITRGGDIRDTLDGIKAAFACGLMPVKINIVLMKGINDGEIRSFLRLALDYPLHLRFIEYMPIDVCSSDWKDRYLPLRVVEEEAAAMGYPMEPMENTGCSGPAQVYRLPGAAGSVGLIHPISRHFCFACNRLRLTSDGYIKPCLYWKEELSVRPFLSDQEGLKMLLQKALDYKREKHGMYPEGNAKLTGEEGQRGMSKIGG
mgnify:CR=1 FL=1